LHRFNVAGGMALTNGLLYCCIGRGFDPAWSNAVAIFDTNANFVGLHPLGQEPRFVQHFQPIGHNLALACYFGTMLDFSGDTNLFYYDMTTFRTNGDTILLTQHMVLNGFALSPDGHIYLNSYEYPEPPLPSLSGGIVFSLWKADWDGNVELNNICWTTNFAPYSGGIPGNCFFMSNDFSKIYIVFSGPPPRNNTNYVEGWSLAPLPARPGP
jgi:hypothetical protein